MDLAHRLVQPVLRLNQFAPAAGQGRQPAQECLVDRRVDTDRVDADAADTRCQRVQNLVLVADLPVGDQHDHPVPGIVLEEANSL